MSTDELHDVPPADWHEAVAAAHATGFTFFDWLSAVDRTYDAAAPGYDVVLRALTLQRRWKGQSVVWEGMEIARSRAPVEQRACRR